MIDFRIACPIGYEPDGDLEKAKRYGWHAVEAFYIRK